LHLISTCLSGNISLVNHMCLVKYILKQHMFQIKIVENEACILCLLHFLHKWWFLSRVISGCKLWLFLIDFVWEVITHPASWFYAIHTRSLKVGICELRVPSFFYVKIQNYDAKQFHLCMGFIFLEKCLIKFKLCHYYSNVYVFVNRYPQH